MLNRTFSKRGNRFSILLIIAACCVLLLALLWAVRLNVYDNFGTVEPGRVFRSAQMGAEHLRGAIERHHIKSVLNLRGANPSRGWYAQELSVSSQEGIQHYDVPLSAKELPSPQALRALLKILDQAPYPMLIHCRSGADRTGLVSAIVLVDHDHEPVDEATGQLTALYGHIPAGKYKKMDEFFQLYQDSGSQKTLRQWILEDYPRVYSEQKGE